MRFRELVRFALRGLRRQKVRTLLTTVGVAVGACMLAFSASLGMGLRALIDHEFQTRPGFWEVYVMPGTLPPPMAEAQIPQGAVQVEGEFAPERAARFRRQLVQRYQNRHAAKPPAMLTDETIKDLAAMPDVLEVVTARFAQGWCTWSGKSAFANMVSGRSENPMLAERVVAGRLPQAPAAECAVSEMLLYDLGVRSEAQLQAALGTAIAVELGDRDLPAQMDGLPLSEEEKLALRKALAKADRAAAPRGTFTIVGIVRAPVESDDDVRGHYLFRWTTLFTDGPAAEAMYRKLPHLRDGHYEQAEAKVRPGSDLPAIVKAIEAKGFRTNSAAEWFTSAKKEVTLIGAGLNVFAIVSLLVAAIGITNTLVTSVVERTREIGILKAVGATGGQVRSVFLIEGTIIGLAGGVLGLILARVLAGPADEWVLNQVRAMMTRRTLLTETIFTFPYWLTAATPVFAMLVTTLAALYPAHRASRIPPVEALRYG